MKILVTGSSGHLGEALVRRLSAAQHTVIGIDILPSAYTNRVGSITDMPFIHACMQGVDAVVHTATLHKPHVVTHSKQQFIDTNITGTLVLLEAAVANNVNCFIYTSTTSVFGDALSPAPEMPAAWITEDTTPIPKNIYGVTKLAAENLCQLFHRNHQLPCLVLRTARFFLEADDNPAMRKRYADANIKLNELLYRRADIEDIVSAHLLAIQKATEIGFDRFIISATPPFVQADCQALRDHAASVVKRYYPEYESSYRTQGWEMFAALDRVYVNAHARKVLGWQPHYTFAHGIACLAAGQPFLSPLATTIGKKGYHPQSFEDGPYPVESA